MSARHTVRPSVRGPWISGADRRRISNGALLVSLSVVAATPDAATALNCHDGIAIASHAAAAAA